MDVNTLVQSAVVTLTAVAWKVAGALVLWLVGRWLIGFAVGLVGRSMARQGLDVTLTGYLQTGLGVLLNVALIVALLGTSASRPPVLRRCSPLAASPSAWRGAGCSPTSPRAPSW